MVIVLQVAVAAPQRCSGCPNTKECHSRARGAALSWSRSLQLCGVGSHGDAGWQSGWAVPTQRPRVTQSSCHACAQEMLLLSSGELHQDPGGERASHGAFPTMNKH